MFYSNRKVERRAAAEDPSKLLYPESSISPPTINEENAYHHPPDQRAMGAQVNGEQQQHRCCCHAGCVPPLCKGPGRMANPVDQLDDDPEPDKRSRRRPPSSHRPKEAPKPKRYKRDIENDKSALKILRNEPAHESSRRKHLIEATDVFLD